MRRINPSRFKVATRGTSRDINSRIVLNLVRAHQPISRADLARTMEVSRAAVTLIVNDLLARKLIFEGATGETERGRKPTFLYIDSRRRAVIAADIRASETFVMLADVLGKPLTGVISFPTAREPKQQVAKLAARIKRLMAEHPEIDGYEGIGVVVPGMVEHSTMRVLHAPTLGWRNVDLREPLAAATGLDVQIENSGRACALAQMWALRGDHATTAGDLVYISVSDGIGVGVIMNGEVLRGRHNIAGEFGHVPLSLDGPKCSCGSQGCWEAYISNRATLARYFGRPVNLAGPEDAANRPVHGRGSDHAGARQRRQGGGRHRSHRPVSRARSRLRHQRARSVARLHRRRDHAGLGSHRGHGADGARRARADALPRPKPRFARWPPPNIRAWSAPPRWWPRPRLLPPSSPEGQ